VEGGLKRSDGQSWCFGGGLPGPKNKGPRKRLASFTIPTVFADWLRNGWRLGRAEGTLWGRLLVAIRLERRGRKSDSAMGQR